eukprot:194977_1
MKCFLRVINILLFLVGAGMVVMGIILLSSKDTIALGSTFGSAIAVVGALLMLLSMMTYAAAVYRYRCLLSLAALLLTMLAVVQCTALIMAYKQPDYVLAFAWKMSSNADRVAAQNEHNCCGIVESNPRPGDPCPDNATGVCAPALSASIMSLTGTLMVMVAFAAVAAQALDTLFACCFVRSLRRLRDLQNVAL